MSVANLYKELTMQGDIAPLVLTINCALLKSSSDPVFNDDDDFVSDVTGRAENTELTDGSYARVALASKTIVHSDANDRAEFGSAKVTFSALAGAENVEGCIIFDSAGGADTARDMMAGYDLADTTTNGNDFDVLPASTDPGDWLRLT